MPRGACSRPPQRPPDRVRHRAQRADDERAEVLQHRPERDLGTHLPTCFAGAGAGLAAICFSMVAAVAAAARIQPVTSATVRSTPISFAATATTPAAMAETSAALPCLPSA